MVLARNQTTTEGTMAALEFDGVGGYLEPEQEAGHEWDVTLSFIVDVELSVLASHDRQSAIEEAELQTSFSSVDGVSDTILANTEAEPTETIYADDPRAEHILGYCDGPTAPSSGTFWDDTVHFDEKECADYADDSECDSS